MNHSLVMLDWKNKNKSKKREKPVCQFREINRENQVSTIKIKKKQKN